MLEEGDEMNQHVMAKLDIGNRLFFLQEACEETTGGRSCRWCVYDEELLPGAISSAPERDKILVCYS